MRTPERLAQLLASVNANVVGEHVADLCHEAAEMIGGLNLNLLAHLKRQIAFSRETFGPGQRSAGVVDHIRKELREIETAESPREELTEWIDVAILAFDGAWRIGYTAEDIVAALVAKQTKNESRRWPDWRTAEPGKAIEHVRDEDEPKLTGTISKARPCYDDRRSPNVCGIISDDAKERFGDDTFVFTSRGVSLDGDILKTRFSRYRIEWDSEVTPAAIEAFREAIAA